MRSLSFYTTLDLRSLAAFRISLAAVLLCDLVLRWPWIDVLYTNQGVMPAHDWFTAAHTWIYVSPLRWIDEPLGVRLFFLTTMASLGLLLVGYRTRLFMVTSLILWASISHRNPLVLIGADQVAATMLLWGTLLPTGKVWSLDAWRSRPHDAGPASSALPVRTVYSPPSLAAVAVVVQIALIYFFTAWNKTGSSWHDGTAVHYVLRMEQRALPLAVPLRDLPLWAIQLLSYGTLLVEYAAIPLIFSPWGQPWCRRVLLVSLLGLHAGIGLTLNAGTFSYVMLCSLLLLLRDEDWIVILRWFGRAQTAARSPAEASAMPRPKRQWALDAVTAVLMFLAACNVYVFNGPGGSIRAESSQGLWQLANAAQLTSARQRWDMFAPDVPHYDYWWVAVGETAAGKTIDPLTGQPPDFRQPSRTEHRYGVRWSSYLKNLLDMDPQAKRIDSVRLSAALARYLANQNAPNSAEKLTSVTLYSMSRRIPKPGEVPPDETYALQLGKFDVSSDTYTPTLPRIISIWNNAGWKVGEGPVRDDLEEGLWRFWYADGQLRSEGAYTAGKRNGTWTEWAPAGWKQASGPYVRGERTGLWTTWYPSGQRQTEIYWIKGHRTGPYHGWYESGGIERTGNYQNDLAEGEWELWYEIGTPRAAGDMHNGLRSGKWSYYSPTGSPEASGTFQDGVPVGVWHYFQPFPHSHDFGEGQKQELPQEVDLGQIPRP